MSGFSSYDLTFNNDTYDDYERPTNQFSEYNDPVYMGFNASNYENIINAILNASQNYAANHLDGPMLVLAGAGTGKTRTIVHRVSNLVKNGVREESILMLTFTKKASNEMCERLKGLLETENLKIAAGTFHSIAYKLIRENNSGDISRYSILDQGESKSLIKTQIKELFSVPIKDLFTPAQVLKVLSYSVNTGLELDSALEKTSNKNIRLNKAKAFDVIMAYKRYKENNNYLDFDDILLKFSTLLKEDSEFLQKVQDKYEYIMVDEYQDTNFVQNQILHSLLKNRANRNLLVVGDDAQSIYKFRGADHKNILNFPKEFGNDCQHNYNKICTLDDPQLNFEYKLEALDKECKIEVCTKCKFKICYLEQNYRSNINILNIGNKTIEVMKDKYEKNLYSKIKSNHKPTYCEFSSHVHQFLYILDIIKEEQKSNRLTFKFADFCILARASRSVKNLEKLFVNKRIPYARYGGMRYIDSPIFKNFISMLRIIVKIDDFEAYKNILKLLKGVGEKSVIGFIEQITKSAQNLIKNATVEKYISTVRQYMFVWINDKKYSKMKTLLDLLFNHHVKFIKDPTSYNVKDCIDSLSKYLESLMADNYKDKKIEDKKAFIKDISEIYHGESNLDDVVASILDMSAKENLDNKDKVVISTIHSAKGLEFKNVFIIDCNETHFKVSAKKNKNDDDEDDDDEEGMENEEEKRLFYVACTRAKYRLFLLNPYTKVREHYWEEGELKKKFIEFIGTNEIKKLANQVDTKSMYIKKYDRNREFYDKIFSKENKENEEYDKIRQTDEMYMKEIDGVVQITDEGAKSDLNTNKQNIPNKSPKSKPKSKINLNKSIESIDTSPKNEYELIRANKIQQDNKIDDQDDSNMKKYVNMLKFRKNK